MKLSILASLSLCVFLSFFSMIHHLVVQVGPYTPEQRPAVSLVHADHPSQRDLVQF